MPRVLQAFILSAARKMSNLEEREEAKKEKASVASENLKKKMYPILIENLEHSK